MTKTKEYRVWGPPGTGKTSWIVDETLELVDRFGEDQISICSLTNAAVRQAVKREIPLDADNITTLHAKCKRSLQAGPPAETRMDEFVEENPAFGTEECVPKMYRNTTDAVAERAMMGGATLYDLCQLYRQQLIPIGKWREDVAAWYRQWDGWCKARGLMDFTGWLETALEADCLPPQQVVMVDEAQDHTLLQLKVLRNWNARNLILVGDDDQNLYEWSGAIPDKFFSPDLPLGREKVLGHSFRVPRAVHPLAMDISSRINRRKVKDYSPKEGEGKLSQSYYSFTDARAGMPLQELEDGREHMVLASCAYMLKDLAETLKADGIPFHNPYRRGNTAWNPLNTKAATVAKSYLLDRWTGASVKTWVEVLNAKKTIKDRDSLLEFCDINQDREISPEEIFPYLKEVHADTVLSRDPRTLLDLRRSLAIGSWDYYTRVFKEGSDLTPRVVLGTVHSVKGGEAEVVHVFPDMSSAGWSDMVDNPDRAHRLFYVAVTRAKEEVVLHDASSHMAYSILEGRTL